MKKTLTCAHSHARADLGKSRLLGATYRTEALLELVDTTLGIHELVLTGEEGVRVGSNTARNHVVLNTIDNLSLSGGSGGTSDEAAARGDVHEHYRIVLGMQISFHSLTGCVTVAARSNYTLPLTLVKLYLNFILFFATITQKKEQGDTKERKSLRASGRQDSNLRHPAPKAGALPG